MLLVVFDFCNLYDAQKKKIYIYVSITIIAFMVKKEDDCIKE